MILVAVIVGYMLGALPHIIPKIIEMRSNKVQKEIETNTEKDQKEILDEWLNGEQNNNNNVTQEDIYQEYLTGKVVKGG